MYFEERGRRIAAVAAILIAVSIHSISLAPAASAVIPGRVVMTLNMRGFNGGGGPSNTFSPNAIIASLENRSPRPLVVALTEVCNRQLQNVANMNLWSRMVDLGYTLASVEMPINPGGDCGAFGVVTFVQGPQIGGFAKNYIGSNGFLACAGSTTTVGGTYPFLACSIHLSSHLNEAASQWSAMLDDMNALRPFGWVLWAGDLNMDAVARDCNAGQSKYHANINGLFWPAGFTETDADGPPLSTRKTWKYSSSNQSCHLDYIGYQRDIWRADPAMTRANAPSSGLVSDHYIYEGSPGSR